MIVHLSTRLQWQRISHSAEGNEAHLRLNSFLQVQHWISSYNNVHTQATTGNTLVISLLTMLASRLRPCATQFGKFALPLRVQYSSAAEKTYEHIKVSTPRPGVGLGEHSLRSVSGRTAP